MSFYFDFVNALKNKFQKALNHAAIAIAAFVATLVISNSANALPAQYPLFIANPVKPIMVLNMSKDHQLFFKLYDDYSDIIDMRTTLPTSSSASSVASSSSSSSAGITNPNYGKSGSDGVADRTYTHQYHYYGYFDSEKCYTYSNGIFTPSRLVNSTTRYCNYGGVTNEWSGNLLNWASMTRLDAVRKILYGGKRYIDSEEETVLERAFIPEDAHAFAKYYNGTDIHRLTPFRTSAVTGGTNAKTSGITFCNATSPSGEDRKKESQVVAADSNFPPLLKVAKGNFSLWGANEGYQCRWGVGKNDNKSDDTKIQAYSESPKFNDNKLGDGDYSVRVKVCVSTLISSEEGCKQYDNGHYKPIGLLQEFGEKDAIHFGLITGSYLKNKQGGVLRKNVGNMRDEINLTTGQFSVGSNADSIINTLNLLTIAGYYYDTGQYNDKDSCSWGISSFNDGTCTNWGNPQSEIYLESLRYLAGKSANFSADDSSKVPGLREATWVKPVTTANYCAPLNILQFNASTSSYDGDNLSGVSSLGITEIANEDSLNSFLNNLGVLEGISGKYFVGVSGSNSDELCTPKTITALSTVKGTCPDAPRLGGVFHMAGIAYAARKDGIAIDGLPGQITNAQGVSKRIDNTPSVYSYGVALAPALPKVEIPIPGHNNVLSPPQITILPACRNTTTNPNANCAIVDFKIISQNHSGNTRTGSLYVNWEDSEQGGDYDQDMWGLIDYEVTGSKVKVTTQVFAQATDHKLGFGYVIGGLGTKGDGTTDDGFKVQTGINHFEYGNYCKSDSNLPCNCRVENDNFGACTEANTIVKRAQEFDIQTGSAGTAQSLKTPLYYAAKWGGYANDNATTAEIANTVPSNYYYATDPRQLAQSLREAFLSIAERKGSSSGVATNSTSLNESSFLFQAVFNSENWLGSLNSFSFDNNGLLIRNVDEKGNLIPTRSTDTVQPNPSNRTIYTFTPGNAPNNLTGSTINFSWSGLTTVQRDFLKASSESDYTNAQKRFNWLRGIATDEGTDTSKLRSRNSKTGVRNIIGDIVNSTPVYVGATNFRYDRLPAGGSSYAAYVTSKASKTPKVIVGANDGMLHVFNARTLEEIYAYVPNLVFPKLRNLSAQNYGKPTNPHQYVVDGPLTVSDVYNGTSWRTIVVGTLGGGGRGVFALDVTDDTSPQVLFEISDADFPKLGYVLNKPIVVPMANGRWAAIFGNGDSSGRLANAAQGISAVATESSLFIVDIYDPKGGTRILSTGSGKGLSAPAVLLSDSGVAKLVYAGDLSGQMWKFDVSATDAGSWAKSYMLYHAQTTDGKAQPITAAPTLGINSSKNGAIAVYFGTGKYYEENDHKTSATNPYHTFYAITDTDSTTVAKNELVEKTISNTVVSGVNTRAISSPVIAWASYKGWYLNFGSDEERIIAKPLLMADRVVFLTIIPSATTCDYGGTSWLLSTPAVGDKFVNFNLMKEPAKERPITLGEIGFALTKDGASILTSDTSPNIHQDPANQVSTTTGRQSWRELD